MSTGPVDPRLVRRSAAVRRHLLAAVGLGTATACVIVTQAWLLAVLIARGFQGEGTHGNFRQLLMGVAGVFVLRALLTWIHRVSATRAAVKVKSQLRAELAEAVLDPRRTGALPESSRLVALFGEGLDALDAYFAKYLPQLVLAVTVPALVCAAVLWADPVSAITLILTLPLIVVFMVLVGRLTKDKTERRWVALKRLGHHFFDVIDGLVVLKEFGRSQTEGLRAVGEQHRKHSIAALKLAFLSSLVLELFSTLAVALVAVGVGLRVVDGRLSLQTAMFVLLLAPEAFLPVRQVGAHFHDSAEGVAASRDAFDILDGVEGREGELAPPPPCSTIILDRVSVTYPGRTSPALAETSARIKAGEFLALTGPSGSGKSTLLGVLLGTVRPSSGSVSVAGLDLDDVDIAAWRRRIAWVPQVPGMIDGSIESNVRLGLGRVACADVRRALDDAGAAELPLGRHVHDGGVNLSAGERRRVGIARALLRARHTAVALLLLDEPTAGLDAAAEFRIVSALRDSGITVIVVTHRREVRGLADREIGLSQAVNA